MRNFRIYILVVIVFLSIIVTGFVSTSKRMATVKNTTLNTADIIFQGNPTTGSYTHDDYDPAWLSKSTFEIINNSDKKLKITLEKTSCIYGVKDKFGNLTILKDSSLSLPKISSGIMVETNIYVMPNSKLSLNLNYKPLSKFSHNNSNEYEAIRLWLKVGDEIVNADSEIIIYRREPWINE